jgi:hypothetical protein
MEQVFAAAVIGWGTPATGAAIVALLIKMNNTMTIQKDATLKLIHELDKRVTVIESRGL